MFTPFCDFEKKKKKFKRFRAMDVQGLDRNFGNVQGPFYGLSKGQKHLGPIRSP